VDVCVNQVYLLHQALEKISKKSSGINSSNNSDLTPSHCLTTKPLSPASKNANSEIQSNDKILMMSLKNTIDDLKSISTKLEKAQFPFTETVKKLDKLEHDR
jgi:hypothetical protein